MIQAQTKLNVADNTGAKLLKCIKVIGGSKQRVASLGSIILCVVKKYYRKSLKKKQIFQVLVVQTRKKLKRRDGSFYKSNKNKGVILTENLSFRGTRVTSYITKELRQNNHLFQKYKNILQYSKKRF